MSLLVTLKRGRKTKTVRVNPSHSRLKRAGYKRTLAVGGGIGWVDGNRPWIEYARGGRAMKGEPSTVYRKRYFKTIAERDRALFDNPKRRRKNPHSEQVELKLFIDSDGDLYRRIKGPIEKNLTKKFVKGTYNHKLAVKAWKYLADEGAKKYAKDFSIGSDWNRMFSVADRKEVAQQLADDWLAELKAGNRHNPRGGKQYQFIAVGPGGTQIVSPWLGSVDAGDQWFRAKNAEYGGKLKRHRNKATRSNPRVSKTKIEYVIQGNYGHGWEDENYETNKVDAKRSLKEYRENMPQYAHRFIKRRVPKES